MKIELHYNHGIKGTTYIDTVDDVIRHNLEDGVLSITQRENTTYVPILNLQKWKVIR